MFFLIRLGFWIAIVLLLLPLSLEGKDGRDVSVFDAFGAIQAAVSDARGFCQRQPDACAVGGQMIGHLGDKAQAGAKWLYETIGSKDEGRAAAPNAGEAASGGTSPHALTPQDLGPAWGGEGGHPAAPAATPAPLPPRRPA